jgi:hypothetical protein
MNPDGGNGIVAVKFTVLRKTFGPRHHRRTCKGTSIAVA